MESPTTDISKAANLQQIATKNHISAQNKGKDRKNV